MGKWGGNGGKMAGKWGERSEDGSQRDITAKEVKQAKGSSTHHCSNSIRSTYSQTILQRQSKKEREGQNDYLKKVCHDFVIQTMKQI